MGQRRIPAFQPEAPQVCPPPGAGIAQRRFKIQGAQRLGVRAKKQERCALCLYAQAQRWGAELAFSPEGDGRADIQLRSRQPRALVPQADEAVALFNTQACRVLRSEARVQLPAECEPLRAANLQHAYIEAHGDNQCCFDLTPGDLFAPDGETGGIADLAEAQTVGKEAHGFAIDHGIHRLGPACRANILRRGQQAHLPGVLQPQPRRAEIGCKGGETAVCENMLPDARRQAFGFIDKAVLRPAKGRDLPAAHRHGKRGSKRRGQRLFLADEDRRAITQNCLRRSRRGEDAAPCRHQRLQPAGCEPGFDLTQGRAPVLALFIREVNQLRFQPAALQEAEGPQQPVTLRCPGAAAQQRVIAGNAPAPEGAFGRGCTKVVFPKRQHQLHGLVQLLTAHAEAQCRRAHHIAGASGRGFQYPPRRVEGLPRAVSEGDHKAQGPLAALVQRHIDPHAQ